MRVLVMALIALWSSLLAPGPGFAQQQTGEKLVVAKCGASGCACTLSDIDAEALGFLLGGDLPPDAMQKTWVIHDGQAVLSPLSPDEVDLAMGGDGRCDLALFDPIQPRDGTWTGSVRVQSVTGCLPQVAAMVPALADGMSQSKQIAWDGRFHPNKLVSGPQTDIITWTAQTPERFIGRMTTPQTGVIAVTGAMTATLLSPDKATATLRLTIAAAPGADASALALIGMANCQTFAIYEFVRQGS